MIEPFIIIPNFISPDRADALGKEYMQYCEDVKETPDFQAKLSCSTHGYITFLELLFEKIPEIEKIVGDSLFPTYCYSRVYKNGSILEAHTDKKKCEVSISVHLCADEDWNFWIKDDQGTKHDVSLKPGDAVLYYGMVNEHGRTTEYTGQYYTQVFLHYVKTRGDYSDPYKVYLARTGQINKDDLRL